jgi:nucleoid-associated protein YgaU
VVTTALVVEALTGRHRLRRGCPAALRRLVLSACGAALVAGASPAAANTEAAGGDDGAVAASHGPAVEDRSVLAGLPVPDRTAGPPQTLGAIPVLETHVVREVRVRAGDSLWSLAAADLAPGAPAAAVVRHWRLVWQINRAAIGADPDVIQPGTDLRLPPREDA